MEYDYKMIGICSHHSDYRLVWSVNNELGFNFGKSASEFVMVNKKGVQISKHSFYEWTDEDSLINFFLIKNKAFSKFLIPEKEEFDYFLFVCEDHLNEQADILISLKNVAGILTAVEFDPKSIKSTENLFFG